MLKVAQGEESGSLIMNIGIMKGNLAQVVIQSQSKIMSQQLGVYLSWLVVEYEHLKQQAYARVLQYWPRFGNYNSFERFIILNLIIIGIYLLTSFLSSLSFKRFYARLLKIIYDLPPVRRKIQQQMEKARADILKQYPPHLKVELDKIPYKTPNVVLGDASEKDVTKGKKSGQRYAIETHSKFVCNLSKHFAYSNPLHLDTFPLVRQMEAEVIAMTAEAIGIKDQKGQPCGTLNSGGTESILMALFAYRQFGTKTRGVYRPNLVLCTTAHPAAIKACHYFDIELKLVPCDSNYRMNFSKMKSAIDENTICVYASYPNYPYGTVDEIDIIGPYCHKKGIPVHLDMCLGGFVAPFLDDNWKLPVGITSVSADPHKYGLSAKGVSVLLYSSQKYRMHQFFVTTFWPGGLYGTPGIAGSRSGVFIASAWISMMKTGKKGYQENARFIHQTLVKVSEEIEKVGYQLMGKDKICVLSFRHKTISVNAIHTFMKEKGWSFSICQKPWALQFSFTPLSCGRRDDMIKDLKECVEFYKKNECPKKESMELSIYGACAQVKDDGKKNFILATMVDTFIDMC